MENVKKVFPVNPVKFYLLGGIPFYLLLTLKLTGVVQWSWWWITLPVWLPMFFVVLATVAFCVFMLWPMGKGKYRNYVNNKSEY